MAKSLKALQTESANISASNNPLKVAGVTDVSFAPQVSTFGSLTGSIKWTGGVLAPNGKIYGIPYGSTTVLEIDPVTKTTTEFGSLSGSAKWSGGVLAPNGKIYGIPYNSTTVLEIDIGSCYEPCDWALSPLVNNF